MEKILIETEEQLQAPAITLNLDLDSQPFTTRTSSATNPPTLTRHALSPLPRSTTSEKERDSQSGYQSSLSTISINLSSANSLDPSQANLLSSATQQSSLTTNKATPTHHHKAYFRNPSIRYHHPSYRPRQHHEPSQQTRPLISASSAQSLYIPSSNSAFKTNQMSNEEIQPFRSSPLISPSALEANHVRYDHKTKKTDPIIQVTNDQSTFPGRPAGLHPLSIPPLTGRQKFYIIVLQMLGAALLDGAFNFGIGCAMYLNATSVRVWILTENTVAGDMAITIFIQGILTFCIASGMVHVDLRKNKVEAFPFPWPDTAWGSAAKKDPEATRWTIVRWWRKFNNDQGFSRGLHFFSGSDVNDIFNRKLTWRQFFKRLGWSIWKGSILSVIYFFILWPISVAIVAPIWEHKNLAGTFVAPIIKGVYGAVYGLIQNPVCAMIAMGSEDSVRHHRAERQQKQFNNPEKSAMTTTAAERVSIAPDIGFMQERSPSGLLVNMGDTSPKTTNKRLSTRRVDSLRQSLDGLALVPPPPPSPTDRSEVSSAGLGWRSTDVHRRRSLEVAKTRSRYDPPQLPTRSATINFASRSKHNSHNSSEVGNSSPEIEFNEDHQGRRPHVPMRRLTESSIIIENDITSNA
ncbi:uncharacterized protein MELLADRAFT_79831 [Melampsora larici-populina 98AG31]|uniref:Uncharacterized protein n=1 Tax=Melampsora larici-populina (strain 98AG31 / pathotype 3-4-7) TaxID=747676 RepID=F4SD35_MELLP|nr:uncharacterized protein MELLADRAFT_79831 [Melampsora larici-populina 98AG31]EGF97443.1 hypothetical protein MELLADRAFT_79831 [Melampsora larici-populina 98AG31]